MSLTLWLELGLLALAAALVIGAVFILGPRPAPLAAGKHRQDRPAEPEPEPEEEEPKIPGEETQRLRWYHDPGEDQPLYPR